MPPTAMGQAGPWYLLPPRCVCWHVGVMAMSLCDLSEPGPRQAPAVLARQRCCGRSVFTLLHPPLLLPPMPSAWDVAVGGQGRFAPSPGSRGQSLRFCCPGPAPVGVLQLERLSGWDAQARGASPATEGMPEIFLQNEE